jgi:predicted permease
MLEARSLTKYYEHTPAVRNVSFTIRPGEILGYLGSNGAGKSTTVKMLTGLIEPSDGQIFFQGRSVYEDFTAFQRRIGYVPEEAHLYPNLSGWEYLQLIGRLRGMPRPSLEPKIDEFLRSFSLWNDRHDPLSSYSKGMRQKILISAALLHNPDILILDEPFSGLDVTNALVVRSLLRRLAGEGKMILFSSHVLEVVEKVCTNVLILRKGEVVAYDSINRLQELMSQPSLEGVFAQLSEAPDTEATADRIMGTMASAPAAAPVPERERGPGSAQLLTGLLQDIRYGLRSLFASPAYTLVALLSLSLGICIATCAFTEMNGMTLRRVPLVSQPDDLVAVQAPASYPAYQRLRQQEDLFASTMAYAAPVPFAVTINGRTERIWGHLVSPSYFSTLGVRPEMGAYVDSQSPGVVLSHRFWRDRLGGGRSIVGKTLRVNGHPVTVVAIAPNEFLGASPFLFPADLWMPVSGAQGVAPELADHALERRDTSIFFMLGRLRPGITSSRAEAELNTVAQQFDEERVDFDRNRKDRLVTLVEGGKLFPLRKQDLPFFTSFLTIMAALIMLIACANVANMALARATRRRKEIAIRLALGAGRARLVRQLLTESTVVALAAGVIGFVGSAWLMALSAHNRMPFPMPVSFDFRPDGRVLLLTLALSLCTGIIFGMAPALQATRADLTQDLKEGGNHFWGSHRRFSLRNILIVTQVAVSLTLLVVLGLLSIGIQSTLGIQSGFDARNLYAVALDPVRDGYSGAQAKEFLEKLLDRVKTLPPVTSATLTETVPVSMPGTGVLVSTVRAIRHTVGKDYFATAGIPILFGRAFRREDESENSTAVIVTEALARELWEGQAPVGRLVEIRNALLTVPKILPGSFDYRPTVHAVQSVKVIGVAANVSEGLVVGKPKPAIYFPLRPSTFNHPSLEGITLMVRGAPGSNPLDAVRREISALDARITPFHARSMNQQIEEFMSPLQIAAWTYGLIGLFGIVLASVGLAGVTAYSVAQRGREIGIRMALGAENRDVLALVMKEGLILVAAGTVVGMVGAWTGSRLLAAMNSSVGTVSSTSTSDPTVLFGAPLLLALIAVIACYLPARRSVTVDPAVVLRQE